MTLLFQTIHGSHLYGIAHEGSDIDLYAVFDGKFRTIHKASANLDVTTVSLDNFLLQAEKGVPQALEAMWASNPSIDRIQAVRAGFRPNLPSTINTYASTISSFLKNPTLKMMRHAARLTMNLRDLYDYGAFDPALSDLDKAFLETFASLDQLEEVRDFCRYLSPVEILARV